MSQEQIYDFQRGLQLRIKQHGAAAIEFELRNKLYYVQKQTKLKRLLTLLSLFGLYFVMTNLAVQNGLKIFQRNVAVNIGFGIYSIYLVFSIMNLIKKEKLLFCTDFAMQFETERFLSRRKSFFINASNIYDICINEVIERLDVHYLLIVRIKGNILQKKPILPLFNSQKPPVDCLAHIYTDLNKMFSQTTSPPT